MATRSSSSSATSLLLTLSLFLHIRLYEYGYRVFLPVSRKQASPPDCPLPALFFFLFFFFFSPDSQLVSLTSSSRYRK
ncbi:uncharacterized protein LY79DRAFT_211797 [Colletotrichum navitas]|uniref:Uncharacterized protein n=1 Tax=Colletotrichum navitas TaxID=681940 RepID=A0AAD8QDR7_9PEZI|nr:uncharacterized protein LY79DRAFT_211797 [Colletotrichum navitas]KAK1599189.1 hypothetical protein LY79DRAFT_211797 [Colletotrichum navitas]